MGLTVTKIVCHPDPDCVEFNVRGASSCQEAIAAAPRAGSRHRLSDRLVIDILFVEASRLDDGSYRVTARGRAFVVEAGHRELVDAVAKVADIAYSEGQADHPKGLVDRLTAALQHAAPPPPLDSGHHG